MRPRLSVSELDLLHSVADLEYRVAQNTLTRAEALREARRERIPEHLLDEFSREPSSSGRTALVVRDTTGLARSVPLAMPNATADKPPDTDLNRRLRDLPFDAQLRQPPISRAQAESVCATMTERLGFPVRLTWDDDSVHVSIHPEDATEVVLPGGVVRHPGMTEDALTLIVAHERAHRVLTTWDEAKADYWSTRHGLRLLWPDLDTATFERRAFLAAYTTLVLVARNSSQPLSLLTANRARITMQAGGYPTLQSRWELLKAGIMGWPQPSQA